MDKTQWNGYQIKLGVMGSYFKLVPATGILSYLDMKIPQPAMHGQWLIFANGLMYYTVFQGGSAYRLNLCHNWLGLMHNFRPNAEDYEHHVLENEGYDTFWDPVMVTDASAVNFPSIHLAGWYDIFLQPMLETFKIYDTTSSTGGKGTQRLIVEPRGHCFFIKDTNIEDWFLNDLFAYVWAFETSVGEKKKKLFLKKLSDIIIILDIFLSQSGTKEQYEPLQLSADLDKYTFYVMGPFEAAWDEADGMYWTTLPDWPQATSQFLYLTEKHALSSTAPSTNTSTSFIYDPSNPVPTRSDQIIFYF